MEPGLREQRDCARVRLGIRPEGRDAVAARVRMSEPTGAGLDHAINEELDGSAAPKLAFLIPERDLITHLGHGEQRAIRN